MKIDSYISELLYEHDCVIVTDLGGFITHYRPATLNKTINKLNPPSKKVAFNASLKNNDGLLAHHISNREALNYAEATKVIAEFSKQANAQMLAGKKLKIEKVGILYHDNDKNIQFLPDQNANYLIESFGLSPIHAKMNRSEKLVTAEKQNAPVFINHKKTAERKPFKWKIVEVIPAAAVLAFLLMVPPVLDQFHTNMSSLLPFSRINEFIDDFKGKAHERAPIVIEYPNPFEIPPAHINGSNFETENTETANAESVSTDEVNLNDIENISSSEDPAPVSEPNIESNSVIPDVSDYHIIGGCFQYLSNAESQIAHYKSQNIDAKILGQNKNGLYMVSLFDADNFNEARTALDEIKANTVPRAWIYKK